MALSSLFLISIGQCSGIIHVIAKLLNDICHHARCNSTVALNGFLFFLHLGKDWGRYFSFINYPLSNFYFLYMTLMASFRYYVNRDTLFSYHKASEVFLQRLMALYVASHYKVVIAKLCVNSKDISFLRQGSLFMKLIGSWFVSTRFPPLSLSRHRLSSRNPTREK